MKRTLTVLFWIFAAMHFALPVTSFADETSSSSEWERLIAQADSVSETGHHDSAAVLGYQALELVEREFDPQDKVIAHVLEKTGTYENKFSEYAKAEELFRRSLTIREETSGANHPGAAISLIGLANSVRGLGRFAEAEPYYVRALDIREKAYGRIHEDVAKAMVGVGNVYREQYRYGEADSVLHAALEIYEKVFESDNETVGKLIVDIAVNYVTQMKLAEAEPLFERAFLVYDEKIKTEHPDIIPLINVYAFFNAMYGRFQAADSLGRHALSLAEDHFGSQHLTTGSCLSTFGVINMAQSKLWEAIPLLESGLEIFKRSLGSDHPRVSTITGMLSKLYRFAGEHAKADSLARQAMAIKEEKSVPKGNEIIDGLVTLAGVSVIRGKYAEAESLYVETLKIADEVCEPGDINLVNALTDYSTVMVSQGRYAEAEPLLEKALANLKVQKSPDKTFIAGVINNIATLCTHQGRFEEGELKLRQALVLLEDKHGEDHWQVAIGLQNLADVYLMQGKYAEAETAASRSLSIHERIYGTEHENVAATLDVLGAIAKLQGNYKEEEFFSKRSWEIREKVLGPEHPHVAISIDNLAESYTYQGRYDDAATLHDSAYTIRTGSFGTEHPAVAKGQETYATLLSLKHDWDGALTKGREAFHIRRRNFENNGHSLGEADALAFSKLIRASADRHLSLFFDSKIDYASERRKTADVVVSSKGQVSDMIFDRRKPLVEESDPEILAMADSLKTVQFQLSALFVKGPGSDTADLYRDQIDSLQNLADEIESELASVSSSYRKHQEQRDINLERVVSHLPEDAILIEYLKYDHFIPLTDSIEPRYAVAVITHDSPPEIISLGRASVIERAIFAYRNHMLNVSNLSDGPTVFDVEDYRTVCQPLYETIWQPVEEFVEGKELVLVAPDGGLNMISFAGLPGEKGNYLVENCNLHYLSSGRDLIRLADKPEPASGLFALGDPDYDVMSVDEEIDTGDSDNRTRNIRSSCGELQDMNVPALPGTRNEVEQLILSWQASTDEPVTSYYGQDASEDHFKSDAPGHRIVHLATHGFFLEKSCNPDIPSAGISSGQTFAGENPLLLSGLLFAGANNSGDNSGFARIEDGILTAYEVSSMDLTGAELIVLSACETGLGEVESGEGVYGLRRAFQMAGASSVVSALWPVSDEATAGMMSRLYSGGGESLAESMRSIQIEKIEELRSENKSDHPYSWGAFIALGDWRW